MICRHEIPSHIQFLISRVDPNYVSKWVSESGRVIKTTMMEKLETHRQCKEKTLCRDEIYELYLKLGVSNANNKADDIFFRCNVDEDATIQEEEFGRIIKEEYEKIERKNFKFA